MVTIRIGMVSATQTQNRRVISTSSGFFSSAALTVLGSNAMPQIGQCPGRIAHNFRMHRAGVFRFCPGAARRWRAPAPCRTSGSLPALVGAPRDPWGRCIRSRHLCARRRDPRRFAQPVVQPGGQRQEQSELVFLTWATMPTSGLGVKYFAGSALNFTWQPTQQK